MRLEHFEQVEIENKRIDISIEQTATVCAILVEDNGAGIDEAYLPRLFFMKKDLRGINPKGRHGLFLVKQIIEKGRGQIDVSSLQGEGTTMIITFPMEAEEKVDGK